MNANPGCITSRRVPFSRKPCGEKVVRSCWSHGQSSAETGAQEGGEAGWRPFGNNQLRLPKRVVVGELTPLPAMATLKEAFQPKGSPRPRKPEQFEISDWLQPFTQGTCTKLLLFNTHFDARPHANASFDTHNSPGATLSPYHQQRPGTS